MTNKRTEHAYRRKLRLSNGTLVISFGGLSGGTAKTVDFCQRLGKPVLVVDGLRTVADEAAVQAAEFVRAESVKVLNVAGPRESKHPTAAFAEQVVCRLLGVG